MEELKYPIGKWKSPDTIDKIRCSNWINEIKDLPNQLKSTLSHINENDLQRKYRIESLHLRWAVFLGSLNETDLKKGFIHPQHNKKILLEESIGMYAWHGTHHLHHLKNALKFNY